MSSAAKVGEIFTKAGESYNKLGEMIMLLHPTGQELTALEKAVAKQVHSKSSWGAGLVIRDGLGCGFAAYSHLGVFSSIR